MTLALSRFAVSAAAACLVVLPAVAVSAQDSGEAIYATRCAICHDKPVPRAPTREALRLMSPDAILGSLQGGTMDQLGRGGALGGIEWGMAADDTTVYVPLSDLEFGADMIAGKPSPTAGGGLFAYRFADGKRIWHTPSIPCGNRPNCSPAQPQAATAMPGAVFSGTIGGMLRAYSTDDGSVLWEFDTVRDFETMNGVKARGGTLNGSGPVIADGMVLVGSGYGRFGQIPGNVLICLSVDGR